MIFNFSLIYENIFTMKKSQFMVHIYMYVRMYPYKAITNKEYCCMLTPYVECYMRYMFTPNLMIHFKQLTCSVGSV